MEQRVIYFRGKESKKERLLSYSVEELEDLIDGLNLCMADIDTEKSDVRSLLNAIALLTEIKMYAKLKD